MEQYLLLNVWPDVLPTLQTLKKSGIRLSLLSNMTTEMLNSCIKHSKIATYFENVITTGNAKTYKPSPVAYQLAIDTLKIKREEILFVAFAAWDVAGSKWFGKQKSKPRVPLDQHLWQQARRLFSTAFGRLQS